MGYVPSTAVPNQVVMCELIDSQREVIEGLLHSQNVA